MLIPAVQGAIHAIVEKRHRTLVALFHNYLLRADYAPLMFYMY